MLSLRSSTTRFRSVTVFLTLLLAAIALGGCGLIGDDEDEPSGSASGVTVPIAVMSTAITPEQQATGYVTRAFPEGTKAVYAVLVLAGVEPGTEVTGRWYQLSADNAPPEGHYVNEGTVALTVDNIAQDRTARVSFNLTHNTAALPNGDWLLRVYLGDELIRTMAFVISPLVTLPEQPPAGTTEGGSQTPQTPPASPDAQPTQAAPGPSETPASGPQPTETPAAQSQPETYTVQSGDTLTTIAERFKPADEPTESYVQRLLEANNLEPGGILFVGQVLTLPPPP